MRALIPASCLCATGLFAQMGAPNYAPPVPPSTLTIGAQAFGPSLSGYLQGTLSGRPMAVDLETDLGLGKDKAHTGFFFDYQSQGFGIQLSSGSAEYTGSQAVPRAVTVDGAVYSPGTPVRSWMKVSSLEGIWTFKLISQPDTWLGLDLGVQAWTIDLQTAGTPGGSPVSSNTSLKAPLPQLGLSGGSRAYNGAFESKAYVRYMKARGGTYLLLGTDVRMFLTRWLGLRAFYESGRLNADRGAIKDDLEINIDRKGIGFGGVLRF